MDWLLDVDRKCAVDQTCPVGLMYVVVQKCAEGRMCAVDPINFLRFILEVSRNLKGKMKLWRGLEAK